MSISQRKFSWNRFWRTPLAAPLLIGLAVRLAAFPLAHLKNPELVRHWEYAEIALNLAAGKGYSFDWGYSGHNFTFPTAYMLPGEVMIHYAALGAFGDTLPGHTVLFLEEVAFGGIFIFAMWKLLTLLFGESKRTRWGVWLAALYPGFVVACATYGIASAVLAIDALFLWSLVLTLSKFRTGERATLPAIGTGIFAGLLTQFRSESYLMLGVTAVVLLWTYRRSFRSLLPIASVAALSMAIVCAPWAIRNEIVFHKLILTSINGGFNFWRGNSEQATGSSWKANGDPVWTTDAMWTQIEPGGRTDSLVEFTQDAYHRKAAMEWVRTHPKEEAVLAVKKIAFFWGVDPYDPRMGILYVAFYAITILTAMAGLFQMRKERAWKNNRVRDMVVI